MKSVLKGALAGAMLLSPMVAMAERPVFSVFGGRDVSVSGEVHDGAVAPVADLGPLNPALAGVSAELRIQSRDYDEIYDDANTMGLRMAWERGNGQWFGTLHRTTADGGQVQVGGAFVPALNTTLPVYGRFDDYKATALEGGYRHAFGSGTMRPYVGGRVGATRVDEIRATFTIPDAAIALNNVAFFDSGWVASAGVDAGVEWQLGESANLALQVSADYHGDLKDDDSDIGGLGLGSINDTGSRMAIPVQLIFGWKF